MTTLGNENARLSLEKLKKRAYTIQSRMKELGHEISLAHAYEVLATSSGFRNWPTMKAKASSSERKFHIGNEVRLTREVKGDFIVGQSKASVNEQKPIAIPLSDCVDHFEVIGQNGPIRSHVLGGIAANAIEHGDGFFYLQGCGNMDDYHRLREFARKHGRANDVNVVNLISAAPSSMKYNPFATGSAEDLAEIIVQMPESSSDGNEVSDMWRGRANAMLNGVLRPLVWLRDNGDVNLDAAKILDYLSFEKLHELGQRGDIFPTGVIKHLRSYLESLPFYDEAAGRNQNQITLNQHGYLEMIFSKALDPLVTTYGYIFQHHSNSISLDKIIAEKRILMVLFPNLSKSSDNIGCLTRLFYLDLIRAMKRRKASTNTDVVTAVIDNCEAFLLRNLEETMAAASDANSCLVFGWEKSPLTPALKRSTSVHLSEIEAGRATVITKNARHNAAMKFADF